MLREASPMTRILIVGAGALGGYIGARLLAARRDVTFLVRARRAAQLEQTGLQLDSPLGRCAIAAVRCIGATAIAAPFDLVIVACKACDLDDASTSFAPAVGPATAILPLLNGIAHIDALVDIFGGERVLGGQCMLAAALTPTGGVRHLNDSHAVTLGELDGTLSPRVQALEALFGTAGFERAATDRIRVEMWEKCAFIATAMAFAVLTRIGAAAAQHAQNARGLVPPGALLNECRAIAAAEGVALRMFAMARARMILDAPDAALIDLIVGDLQRRPKTKANEATEANDATEAEHILGDLVRRAQRAAVAAPRLAQALAVLQEQRAAASRHPANIDNPQSANRRRAPCQN